MTGWLGWAMVLGSFQCQGVLLLLHIVGQRPAVLAAGAGQVGYIFSSIFPFWCPEHDWNTVVSAVKLPTVVVSYCQGHPHLVLVNSLEGLSLPRNNVTINWPAWHDLVVDWAVKLQHKQKAMIRNWQIQIQHPAQDNKQERNPNAKDGIKYMTQAESQVVSSFPADGHQAILNKARRSALSQQMATRLS